MSRLSPVFEIDELTEIFGYANRRACVRAIRLGIFPVDTFEMAERTVAHVKVVKKYFDDHALIGLAKLGEQAGEVEDYDWDS
jgi:hypothetical protein